MTDAPFLFGKQAVTLHYLRLRFADGSLGSRPRGYVTTLFQVKCGLAAKGKGKKKEEKKRTPAPPHLREAIAAGGTDWKCALDPLGEVRTTTCKVRLQPSGQCYRVCYIIPAPVGRVSWGGGTHLGDEERKKVSRLARADFQVVRDELVAGKLAASVAEEDMRMSIKGAREKAREDAGGGKVEGKKGKGKGKGKKETRRPETGGERGDPIELL